MLSQNLGITIDFSQLGRQESLWSRQQTASPYCLCQEYKVGGISLDLVLVSRRVPNILGTLTKDKGDFVAPMPKRISGLASIMKQDWKAYKEY